MRGAPGRGEPTTPGTSATGSPGHRHRLPAVPDTDCRAPLLHDPGAGADPGPGPGPSLGAGAAAPHLRSLVPAEARRSSAVPPGPAPPPPARPAPPASRPPSASPPGLLFLLPFLPAAQGCSFTAPLGCSGSLCSRPGTLGSGLTPVRLRPAPKSEQGRWRRAALLRQPARSRCCLAMPRCREGSGDGDRAALLCHSTRGTRPRGKITTGGVASSAAATAATAHGATDFCYQRGIPSLSTQFFPTIPFTGAQGAEKGAAPRKSAMGCRCAHHEIHSPHTHQITQS